MTNVNERSKQRAFIKKLEIVSGTLAVWAQSMFFDHDWSLEQVKLHIREASKVCEEEK